MEYLKKKALFLLAMREHSRKELYNKLKVIATSEEEIHKLLDYLEQKGYLSESRFTDSYIHSKAKKWGILKIKHLLQIKGIDRELVNEYISKIDSDNEINIAYDLLLKKIGGNMDMKCLSRGIRFLQSRGFSPDIIKAAIKKLKTVNEVE